MHRKKRSENMDNTPDSDLKRYLGYLTKTPSLIVLGFLVITLFVLAGAPSADTRRDPYTYVDHLGTDPIIFNPVISEDAYSNLISSLIYESLLQRDFETMELKGALAERWEITSDKKTIKFYLRKNVKFHDGHPLTAEDVVYTFDKIMDKNTPNPHIKIYFQDIEKFYATDDYTVVVKMRTPYFMSVIQIGGIEIIPKHIYSKVDNFVTNEYNTKHPIGSGPFVFQEWLPRQKVVLTRNENYWGKKPAMKTLVFKIIEKSDVALQALKKRELDRLNLDPFQWQRQTNSQRFTGAFNKYKYLSVGYRYIGYNTRKFPFNDRRVREAITYLVNRKQILDTILEGLAEITTGNFWVNSPQYNKSLKPREYNPGKAAMLLKQAGFTDSDGDGILDKNGRPFEFEFMVPSGNRFVDRFVPVFQDDLKKAGIKVNIRQIQFQAMIEKINKREFEALMLGWGMGIEGDPYQLWHSSQIEKGHNFTGFTTPEMDGIIEQARQEFDPVKRNKLYHRFHEILYEAQPYTFLFTTYTLVALHNRFTNVKEYPIGLDLREWKIRAD